MSSIDQDDSADTVAEAARLAAIRRWQVLEVPPDGFEAIATLAARIFAVPYAVVSVVDSDRVWFRAHHGLSVDGIDWAPGLCETVVHHDDALFLSDARLHEQSLSNPLVAGEFGLRFYAGAPLRTSDGYTLGALAVLDQHVREITDTEREILQGLAALVVREFELRMAARVQSTEDAAQTSAEHERAENFQTAMGTHGVIGQAIGLVMARRGCDSAAAFDVLRRASQNHNIKLAEVAHRIVDEAERNRLATSAGARDGAVTTG